MAIDYARFSRLVSRCQETVAAPRAPRVLHVVYQTTTEAPLRRYADASAAVDTAMDRWKQALLDRTRALAAMDAPFRAGRSAVRAFYPWKILPDTLKMQNTDTDKRLAIERLLEIIAAYRGAPWADALLDGDTGRQAAVTLRAIDAAREAADALKKAQGARARAFVDARIAFYAFKRVVRDELGAASKDYQRLQIRSVATSGGSGTELVEERAAQKEPAAQEPGPAEPPARVEGRTHGMTSPPRPAFDYNLPRAAADPRRPLPPRRPHRPRRARRGLGGP